MGSRFRAARVPIDTKSAATEEALRCLLVYHSQRAQRHRLPAKHACCLPRCPSPNAATGCMAAPPCSYRQMAGRAGRAGIDTCGECILVNQDIGRAAGERLFTSGAAPVQSCLVDDKKGGQAAAGGSIAECSKTAEAEVVVCASGWPARAARW